MLTIPAGWPAASPDPGQRRVACRQLDVVRCRSWVKSLIWQFEVLNGPGSLAAWTLI
jgi:hypothetical protein